MNANVYGIAALIMWSTVIGLMRSVTEAFGVLGGSALIYTIGALALFLRNGLPRLTSMPRAYLLGAGSIFVLYEVVFSQGIGLSTTRTQAMEVGMLNYLWPCFMVVLAIWVNGQRLRWWVWPGTLISICGIYWCIASGGEVTLSAMLASIAESPLPYACGLVAALTWALYSNLSARFGKGHNAVAVFFTVIALMLWTSFWLKGGRLPVPGIIPVASVLVMGVLFGTSYSLWEVGIHSGNFMLLAVLSYFTPAVSMLFASLWLRTQPAPGFWAGVALVICGSLMCWHARLSAERQVQRPGASSAS